LLKFLEKPNSPPLLGILILSERTRCISGEAWEKEFLKVADYEIPPIQAVGSDDGF